MPPRRQTNLDAFETAKGPRPFATGARLHMKSGGLAMNRTTIKRVVFTRPFALAGLDGTHPAGTFVVETIEQLLEDISFPAWQWHSTVIRLHPKPGLTLNMPVDPEELNAALLQDAAPSTMMPFGIRFESFIRRAHRRDTKMLFASIKSIRTTHIADENAFSARREQ